MRSPHGLVTVPAPMSHVWGETIPAHSSVGSLRSTIYHVASLNNMRSYRNEMRNSCLYLERNGRCLYYGDGFSDLLKQSFSLSWIKSKLCTKHMDGCSFLVQFWSDGWSRCTTILTLPGQVDYKLGSQGTRLYGRQEQEIFIFFQASPTGSGTQPSSYSMGVGGSSPGGKTARAWG